MSRFEHFRLLISHLRVAPGFEVALDEKRQVERLRAVMALDSTEALASFQRQILQA